jgi:hypothetical protein
LAFLHGICKQKNSLNGPVRIGFVAIAHYLMKGNAMITDDSLKQIMPTLPEAKRAAFLPPLQGALGEFAVNTPKREAAFLAQIAHESGEFKWM